MGGREEEERDGGKGGEEIRARQYFQSELLFSILNSLPAGCRYVSFVKELLGGFIITPPPVY